MAFASVAQHQQDTAVFDPCVVEDLSTIMSKSAVRSLLKDMAKDVRVRLNRLAEIQVAAGSLQMIAQDAHDLRSMGGNFGLTEMSARAGVVERAARSQCLDSVRSGMPPLIATGERSLKALAKRPEFNGGRAT